MGFPDRRTANILLTILLFVVVLAIVYVARRVIVIFAFAILFAYLIDPVVRFLQRHSLFFKNLRGPHVLEAYLAFLVLIALAPHAIAPGLLRQTGKLFKEIPALRDDLSTGEIATKLGSKYGWTDAQQHRLKSFLTQHRTAIGGVLVAAERITPDAVGSLVLIPILAIFFLSSGGYLADSLIQHVSTRDNFEAFHSLARELNVTLRHYIRAKVTLSGLSFVYCSTTMLLLGFPRALALGVLAGVLEFIPVVG
jgi:predicted PurR-regulated permease PerM